MTNLFELLKDQWFTAGVTGVVAAILTWLGIRTQKAPDMQESISKAVAEIIKHYTSALEAARTEVTSLRLELADLRRTIEAQNAEIDSLNDHIQALTTQLVKMGIEPPQFRSSRLHHKPNFGVPASTD